MAEMARRKARPPFWQGCHDLVPFLSHQHVPNCRSRHAWRLATENFFLLICMCQLALMTVLVGITVFDFDFRITIGPAAQTPLKPNQDLSRVSDVLVAVMPEISVSV
jgi:hypothetical protein